MKTEYIKYNKSEKGQTVIETALIMIFLLVLLFGIAEIARAWWLKNMLNNAARVGVRVAIVTPGLTFIADPGQSCSWSGSACTSSGNEAVIKACASITNQGLCEGGAGTRVAVALAEDVNSNGGADSGDSIIVTVRGDFQSIVPNLSALSFGLFPAQITMETNASMRYE